MKETNELTVKQAVAKILMDLDFIKNSEEVEGLGDLFQSGVLDSLSFIQFVFAIEDYYNFRFDNADLVIDNFKNIETTASIIHSKICNSK